MQKNHKTPLILGSTSPFRKELLERLNLEFTTDSPDIDETPLQGESPEDYVIRLSLEKAKAVAERHKNASTLSKYNFLRLAQKFRRAYPELFTIESSQLLMMQFNSLTPLVHFSQIVFLDKNKPFGHNKRKLCTVIITGIPFFLIKGRIPGEMSG